MRIVVNVVGAIAVTTAVLVAHGVPDRSPDAASPVSWPILTVGDRVHGYRLMHSPDAIAAFDNGDGTFIGQGLVSGHDRDKSGLAGQQICRESDPEDCIDQATFGGFGSGLTFTGHDDVFLAVPDRGRSTA